MAPSDSIYTWLTGNAAMTDWTAALLATSVGSLSFDFSFWAYLWSHSPMNIQRLFLNPAWLCSSFWNSWLVFVYSNRLSPLPPSSSLASVFV